MESLGLRTRTRVTFGFTLAALGTYACTPFTGTGTSGTGGTMGTGGATTTTTAVTTTVASTASGVTTSTGITTSCTPLLGASPDASCGLFVAPGGTGTGTPEAPFGTIAEAISANTAPLKDIFVCKGTFVETVALPAGSHLYGGLDCTAGWTWNLPAPPDRTLVAPTPDKIALTISGAEATSVFGFTFRSANAVVAGGSSIAAVVDGTTTAFSYVSFEAGDAKDGDPGAAPPGVPADAPTGHAGTWYPNFPACSNSNPYAGGALTANPNCGATVSGVGGQGGIPGGSNAFAGGNAFPGPPLGGSGANAFGMNCNGLTPFSCSPGGNGMPGGMGGSGAGGSGIGTLTAAGYIGVPGAAGDVGGYGGSGAGGGGSCGPSATCYGPGGGGGGAGGCGGAGGDFGRAGGSSLALVSLNATITFTKCDALAGQGGDGGAGAAGGPGQPGGAGGAGGSASGSAIAACKGGIGGAGGTGGQGGGGSGGHAAGVAFIGTPPPMAGIIVVTPTGQAGVHGAGGSTMASDGQASDMLQFD